MGATVVAALTAQVSVATLAPMKPPEVLAERAREILRSVNLAGTAQDSHFGVIFEFGFPNRVGRLNGGQPVNPSDRLATRGAAFWYRESPVPLERRVFIHPDGVPTVTTYDPAMEYNSEHLVVLDREGRLIRFWGVPAQAPRASAEPLDKVDWPTLFRAAELDPAAWTPTDPQWTPPFFADQRFAWVPRDGSAAPTRVEAASAQGRPVYFQLIYPWTAPPRDAGSRRTPAQRFGNLAMVCLFGATMVGSVLVARRNLRLDRADAQGALRLAAFAAASMLLVWVIDEHHVATIWELMLFAMAAGWALFVAALVTVFYLALEPYVRRTWPAMIVSWSRVLAGRIHDPLVARDVLIGCAAGVAVFSLECAGLFSVRALTGAGEVPTLVVSPRPFLGVTHLVSELTYAMVSSVFFVLMSLFILFVVRKVVRLEQAAVLICAVAMAVPVALGFSASLAFVPFEFLTLAVAFGVLSRVGLVAAVTASAVGRVLHVFPFSWPPSAWFSGVGFVGVAVVALVAITAFRIATAPHASARGGEVKMPS